MRVRSFLSCPLIKATKFAVGHAYVGVVKMAVNVVIRREAMLAPADRVGELADGIEVGGAIESDAFIERQAFTVLNSISYLGYVRVE